MYFIVSFECLLFSYIPKNNLNQFDLAALNRLLQARMAVLSIDRTLGL